MDQSADGIRLISSDAAALWGGVLLCNTTVFGKNTFKTAQKA
ncbi:hypothetical protein [Conchiformibius steedae]